MKNVIIGKIVTDHDGRVTATIHSKDEDTALSYFKGRFGARGYTMHTDTKKKHFTIQQEERE